MKNLRLLHLYLGCFFAPMLVFFSLSGIWQILGWQDIKSADGKHRSVFGYLSSLHRGHGFRSSHGALTSAWLQGFSVAMSIGLVISIILGTILAFKYGRGRLALLSLLFGIVVPLGLIFLALR